MCVNSQQETDGLLVAEMLKMTGCQYGKKHYVRTHTGGGATWSPVVPAPSLKLICFYPVFLKGCSAQI